MLQVKLEQGLKIVKIFKEHTSKTCILDDFSFYEVRQKTILEKKAKQQQTQKHVRTYMITVLELFRSHSVQLECSSNI